MKVMQKVVCGLLRVIFEIRLLKTMAVVFLVLAVKLPAFPPTLRALRADETNDVFAGASTQASWSGEGSS
jgi:hypothetical protein